MSCSRTARGRERSSLLATASFSTEPGRDLEAVSLRIAETGSGSGTGGIRPLVGRVRAVFEAAADSDANVQSKHRRRFLSPWGAASKWRSPQAQSQMKRAIGELARR